MSKLFSKIGISGLVLAVFIGIMGLLSLYFFVTIENKRTDLEKRGFRTLEKLGTGMKQKTRIYTNVVKNLAQFSIISPDDSSRILPPELGTIAESLKPHHKQDTNLNEILVYKSTFIARTSKETSNGKGDDASKDVTVASPVKKKDSVSLQITLNEFITPLLRMDFFSDYLLIRNNRIAFSTLKGDMKISHGELLAGTNKSTAGDPSAPVLTAGQEAKEVPSAIQSGNILRITMGGTDYLMFLIPINFCQDSNSYLGGLIEEKSFVQLKRTISSDLIVIFLFILLIIIFSFPVLKVFIMGPRERLTRPGVTTIGISVVTGTLLISIMLSQQLIRSNLKCDHDEQLLNLNDAVKDAFTAEKSAILDQLYTYKTEEKSIAGIKNPIASIFASTSEKCALLKKPAYPFYKNLFWAYKSGKQRAIVTPYRYCPTAYINSRDYFIRPDKYRCDSGWYNMEPIFMQTTGDWSVAYSIPSGNDSIKIIALTTSMHSLKSPVLQQGVDYCLIDNKGKVWYHSSDILDVYDNLPMECQDNEELLTTLNSNEPAYMNLSIRSHSYRAYVSPVPNTDLFVVTLLNPDRVNSIGALTSMFVLCFFGFVFVILLAGYLIMLPVTRHQSKLAGKDYFFSWLLPRNRHNKGYSLMIWINTAIFLFLLMIKITGSFYSLPLTPLMIFLVILMVGHFFLTYQVLTTHHWQPNNDLLKTIPVFLSRYTWFVLTWMVIAVIMPVVLLTDTLFSNETTSYIQRQQQFIAHKLNERTEKFHKTYGEINPPALGDSLFKLRNDIGHYYKVVDQTVLLPYNLKNGEQEDINTPGIIKFSHSLFFNIMNETDPISSDPLIACKSPDTATCGIPLVFNRLTFNEKGEKFMPKSILITPNPWSNIFNPHHAGRWSWLAVLFWFSVLILMTIVGFLISKLVKVLFFSFETGIERPPITHELNEIAAYNVNAVMISYNSPEVQFLSQNGWSPVDFEKTPAPPAPGRNNLVLFNFETGIIDLENFRNNNRMLDKLSEENRIILWLNKPPEQLIDKYRTQWILKDAEKAKTEIALFNKLVSGMLQRYPVFDTPERADDNLCVKIGRILSDEIQFNPAILNYRQLIKHELQHCSNIDMGNCPEGKGKKPHPCSGSEDLVLKIQELSTSFYRSIWDSLTDNEQFMLLDLAQDTLLNLKNKKTITLLLKKGILQRGERIEIVSQSFRNFILTEIDRSTFESMLKQIELDGAWNRFKVPLILVATSIAVFLFITQQNFLSNINTILISGGTLVGVYLKFSGLFTKVKEGS
ncbi:MAG: cache domain-containing protein [Bacteroidota bacterium]